MSLSIALAERYPFAFEVERAVLEHMEQYNSTVVALGLDDCVSFCLRNVK